MRQCERWQKVEELFNRAILVPATQRIEFVVQHSNGDREICDEVISLLAADSQSNEILNESVFPLVAQLLDEDFADLLKKANFASYRLIEMCGRGGMGAVFRAKDRRLEREVALKILPSTTATNLESVMRFQQEARAASAISHPNVAHVYEFGSYDGLYFLAMEYVDGKTLRELIKEKKVDLKLAVETAVQVAKALNAAHRRGVIHRDIKPENIMITDEDVCKVVDFGLAKLSEKKGRTVSASLETTPGIVIGTSAYMSPEQVRGLSVDEQSDVWSLGVVLYEMLAGARPFDGETVSDTQAAILLKETPPLSTHKDLPELERIVAKALHKNVAERYQTVREMLDDLKNVRRKVYDFLNENDSPRETRAKRPQFFEIVGQNSYLAGTFILLFGILIVGSFFLFTASNSKNGAKIFVERVERVTNTGKALQVAISSDGDKAVYVLEEAGREALYLRHLNDATAGAAKLIVPPLTEKGGFVGVSFSPDNQFVYYAFKSEGIIASLYRISLTGGAPEKILEDIDSAPSFSPDGKQFVFLRIGTEGDREDLLVANSDGGGERVFYTRRMPDFIPHKATPAWSPDGELIAVPIGMEIAPGRKKIMLAGIRLADNSIVPLSREDWSQIAQVAWSGDGKSLVLTARKNEEREEKQVWRVVYPSGEATALTSDPNDYEGVSTARNGQNVLTIAVNRKVDVWLEDFSAPNLKPVQLTFSEDVGNGLAWTFDDRVVYSSTASGNSDIWIMSAAGGEASRLTRDPSADTQPVVSPDNRRIVFLSTRSGNRQIWRMNLDGSEQIQLTNAAEASNPAITADGKHVIYYAQSETGGALFRVSIDGGAAEAVATGVRRFPAASLDGKWLVSSCRPNKENANKICISPIRDLTVFARVFGPVAGANSPSKLRWIGRESRAFAYIVNDRGVENLWKQTIDGAAPRPITNFNEDYIYAFDWSPDGKKLLCGRGNTSNHAMLLTLKSLKADANDQT